MHLAGINDVLLFPKYHIKRMSICPFVGDHSDHLVKMIRARLLHCKILFSPK